MKNISVIILNFNTKAILLDCLESIKKYTKDIAYEIIVVDNASTDGSLDVLKKMKDIILIESKENTGFARGNNLGIKVAKGEYILLLNSDILLEEDSIKKIVDRISKSSKIGIASCKLLNKDKTVQKNGGFFPDLLHVILWSLFLDQVPFVQNIFGSYHPHVGSYYKVEHNQDWVTGAFFLIKRQVLDQIKGFNENFFLYVEELEFCYRAKKKGWEVLYTPETYIIHLGGASGSTQLSVLQEYKNLRLFYKIHFNLISRLGLILTLKINILLRLVLKGIVLRKKGAFETYAKALAII